MPDRNRIINLTEWQGRTGFDERFESGCQRSSLSERDVQRLLPQEWPLTESTPGQAKCHLSIERGGTCEGHARVAHLLAYLERTRNDRVLSIGVV